MPDDTSLTAESGFLHQRVKWNFVSLGKREYFDIWLVPKQEVAKTVICPLQFNADPTQGEYLDSSWQYFWGEKGSLTEIMEISRGDTFSSLYK